jgi:small-conductance mechanosensitive channel
MNLVGWGLIYGRDLFTTGNRVQILNFYGDVTSMGLFYFNLLECNPNFSGDQTTGRIIRVPNGLVVSNPVVNYSDAFPFIWHEFKVLLSMDSDHEKASYILKQIIDQQVHPYYEDAKIHLNHYTKDNFVADQQLSTQSFMTVKFAAPAGIEISIRYLCYPPQASKLESEIWQSFLSELRKEPGIKLAHA